MKNPIKIKDMVYIMSILLIVMAAVFLLQLIPDINIAILMLQNHISLYNINVLLLIFIILTTIISCLYTALFLKNKK